VRRWLSRGRAATGLPVGHSVVLSAVLAVALATGAAAAASTGGEGGIANARAESRRAPDPATVVGSLGGDETWVAWTVPGTERSADVCCFDRSWSRQGCSLAEEDRGWGTSGRHRDPAAPRELRVLAEIESGHPVRLIAVGLACPIDGGNRRVIELTGVEVERSLDLLERWSQDEAAHQVRESALAAIAYHAAPEAAERLARLARSGSQDQSGGRLPPRDRRDLRGQALFWLSQTQDPRAGGWIRDVIARDPDHRLREEAVFALSQLDGSVPLLVHLLRETEHPDVRRQALFWLAQSDDPRAMDELDAILNR